MKTLFAIMVMAAAGYIALHIPQVRDVAEPYLEGFAQVQTHLQSFSEEWLPDTAADEGPQGGSAAEVAELSQRVAALSAEVVSLRQNQKRLADALAGQAVLVGGADADTVNDGDAADDSAVLVAEEDTSRRQASLAELIEAMELRAAGYR